MCGGRDTHGGTVVLSVSLGAVPTQEQAPQIGRLAADNSEQFRVRVGWLHLGARDGLSQGNARLDLWDGFPRLWGLCEKYPYVYLPTTLPMCTHPSTGHHL